MVLKNQNNFALLLSKCIRVSIVIVVVKVYGGKPCTVLVRCMFWMLGHGVSASGFKM